MNILRTFRHIILPALILTPLSLLGCGGCAVHDSASTSDTESKESLALSQEPERKNDSKPIPWRLGSVAASAYAYLILEEALRDSEPALIVSALTELSRYDAPVSAFIDTGIWFLEHDPTPVLPVLEKGLKLYPQNTSLNLLYVELLQNVGQRTKAISHIRDFIVTDPDNTDARLELALLLVQDNQFAEAERILEAITLKERTPLVNYYQAKALMGMKKHKEARPFLEKAHAELPDFFDPLADLAFLYEQEGNLKKARDAYEKALLLRQGNLEIVLRIISLSVRLKEVDYALEYYEEYAKTPAFTAAVGSLLVEEDYYDAAEPLLTSLVGVADAPHEFYFYLAAVAYERDKDPNKTAHWLSQIPQSSNSYARATLLRMQLLLEQNKLKEALDVARIGKELGEDGAEFWIMEARILFALKEVKGALESVSALLTKWPDHIDAAFLQASIYDESGQKEAAVKVMESIIAKDANHYQAMNYVGYTLVEENRDLDRALLLIQKAISLSPESVHIQDSLAWVLFKTGKVQEAWRIISAIVAKHKNGKIDPTIWEHYGDIARALGKKDEARKAYRKALEYTPANAKSIQERLTQL